MNTQIIPQHPGFQWNWDGFAWQLSWTVIPTVYSPPSLFPLIRKIVYKVPDETAMGRVIGRNGLHFKKITQLSGALYLFYNEPEIEIWGFGEAPEQAKWILDNHVTSINQSKFLPGFEHLNTPEGDLRPLIYKRQTNKRYVPSTPTLGDWIKTS